MDFLSHIQVDRLPVDRLLLGTERHAAETYTAVLKILYVGQPALVRHPIPFEEPVVMEATDLDVQFCIDRQLDWCHRSSSGKQFNDMGSTITDIRSLPVPVNHTASATFPYFSTIPPLVREAFKPDFRNGNAYFLSDDVGL
jgi:hypothetical protein